MKLHSQIIGEGTPFVILHGFLGMSDNWKTLGNQFAENGYQVHLVDQRNHGRSFHSDEFSYEVMAEDLKKYCDDKGLDDIVLLGHSMGGKTAMQFAAKYAAMISKLIVVDIAPKYYPLHHQDILKALSSLDFSEIETRGQAEEVLAQYIKNRGVRLFLMKNLYRKSKSEFGLRINLPILKETVENIGVGLEDDVVYNGDTLFIAGGNSNYIEAMDGPLIKYHFPNARIETIEGAGHWVHAEKQEIFFKTCMAFLK
jgi:pimeloyl-ACP methyl ester carboxylesterase